MSKEVPLEELEAWLNEDINTYPSGLKKVYDIDHYPRRWDVGAARHGPLNWVMRTVAGEEGRFEIEVSEQWKGVEFVVRGRITDIEVIRTECEHEWSDWRYDTMGGDNRECALCKKVEFT